MAPPNADELVDASGALTLEEPTQLGTTIVIKTSIQQDDVNVHEEVAPMAITQTHEQQQVRFKHTGSHMKRIVDSKVKNIRS